jgi:DNA-binding response OmpR family regulator
MADAPDLLLVDVCLPMMDGISLIKVVRRMRDLSGVPLVAASGVYDAHGEVRQALARLGVYAFLSKPYTVASLHEAVDFAKSAALRQAPPTAGTMKSGGLWEDEDAEDRAERRDRESLARERGMPRALPASPGFEQRTAGAMVKQSRSTGRRGKK